MQQPNGDLTGTDDWLVYQRHASEILHGGWLMPSIAGPYRRPGGFAYNYAVAAVFALFGETTLPIEILQGAALGVCTVWLYRIFRPRLDVLAAQIYLISLAVFLFADQFLYNTRRLLSENLLFLLLPLFLQLVLRGYERKGESWVGPVTGIVGGLVMLTRPNLVPLVIATPLLMQAYEWRRNRRLEVGPFMFLAFALATFALLPLRDVLVTGQPSLQTLTWTGDWQAPSVAMDLHRPASVIAAAQAFSTYYAARDAFVIGLLPILHPGFRVRPHWLLMWALFVISSVLRARDRTPLAFWESLLYMWIVLYIGPLVAVAAIDAYGFRMLVPIIPFVLLFACRSAGTLLQRTPVSAVAGTG
jgi:hypothetical protein